MTAALSYAHTLELRGALEQSMEAVRHANASRGGAQARDGTLASNLRTLLMDMVPAELEVRRRMETLADAMVPIITAYLAGVMDEDLAEPLGQYLASPAGRLVFGPLVAAWLCPDNEPAVTDAQRAAAFARFRASCDALGK